MTLLGKLLILFNLLAAGGFLYLATQDWKGRQTITAAAVRHKLLLVGLPVKGPDNFDPGDETPFRIEMAGSAHTETISKKILELYFQAASAGDSPTFLGDKSPVTCQLAEVKRVRAKIDAILKDKAAGERLQLLNDWLIDQSLSFEQRQEVQELALAGNSAELEKRLMALFDAVQNQPAAATSDATPVNVKITDQVLASLREAGLTKVVELKVSPLKNKEFSQDDLATELAKVLDADELKRFQVPIVNYAAMAQVNENRIKPLDEGERRNRIAHLLVHLSPDPNWQKRVVLVIGIRRYVVAITAQTARFKDMYARLDKLIVEDQKAYLAQERIENALARDRTELANEQSKLKADRVKAKSKEDDFVGQKQTVLNNIKKQLEKIKAEVDELLAKQGQIEAGLFEVQREVAITLDQVYQLELVLAERERELLKINPGP
jgi:hypothetical protein